jgi:hypothetical protein
MSNKRKSDDKVLEEQIVASKLRKTDSLALTVQNNSNENESNKPRRRIDNTFSELTLLADNDVNKFLVYNFINIFFVFVFVLSI